MLDVTFDWVWTQIYQTINNIESGIDETARNNYHFRLTYGDEQKTKDVIFSEYGLVRDDLKSKCYSDAERASAKIDQHKIAACLCRTLIQKKVFSFDVDNAIPREMLLSNYELAYTVSLRIIYIYLLDYYSRFEDKKYLDKLINQKCLKVPETTASHDAYHEGRLKTLALNDYYGLPVDLLTYADMMYWIEHYNKQIIENRIIVDPSDK